jgi:integrase
VTTKFARRRTSTFGTARKLPSGRYQAAYWHDGRRYSAPSTFDSKADADAWLAAVRTDMGRGAWRDPDAGAVTLADYAELWLAQRHDLAQTSREMYRGLLDHHVLPAFGKTALARVTTSSVRSWHADLAARHPVTAAKAYRLLATIYKTALEDGKVVASPVRVKGASDERSPERPVATVAEVAALTYAMRPEERLAVPLAAWCQLRRGEILGLRRKDVDLLRGQLTVAVTKVKTQGGRFLDKAPKTDAGRRTIAVPPNVIPELRDHLDRFVGPSPDALVFDRGYRSLRTSWDNARRAVGLRYRLHDLRHAGLTWTAATGATVAELMHRAGHASPAAALRYQHATAERDKVLADALAELAARADVVSIDAIAG